MLKRKYFYLLFLSIMVIGCQSSAGNIGLLQSYPTPTMEAEWIQKGEALEFEGEQWFPQDGTESLIDAEVQLIGEYKGVQFFNDREDVRPFKRLYTKFGRNKFRYFEKIDKDS